METTVEQLIEKLLKVLDYDITKLHKYIPKDTMDKYAKDTVNNNDFIAMCLVRNIILPKEFYENALKSYYTKTYTYKSFVRDFFYEAYPISIRFFLGSFPDELLKSEKYSYLKHTSDFINALLDKICEDNKIEHYLILHKFLIYDMIGDVSGNYSRIPGMKDKIYVPQKIQQNISLNDYNEYLNKKKEPFTREEKSMLKRKLKSMVDENYLYECLNNNMPQYRQ